VVVCSEQLCYQSQFASVGGAALYVEASYFNHDCQPNVARFNVGDVQFFRTNGEVKAGEELCISYIESECLCENPVMRTALLGGRGFSVGGAPSRPSEHGEEEEGEEEEGPAGPMVGPELQEELFSCAPTERLDGVASIIEEAGEELLEVDKKELSLIQAVSYTQMGQFDNALQKWEECLRFCIDKCPPNDESGVAYALQAALSAIAADNKPKAKLHCATALAIHTVAFGPGLPLLQARFAKEMSELGDKHPWSGTDHIETLWTLF
jgi:hypothetical protein